MHRRWLMLVLIAAVFITLLTMTWSIPVSAGVNPQQPTVALATVTGTPVGVTIIVKLDQEQINVRSGPNTTYEKVGVLLAGQEVPAKGRSVTGEWIEVDYPGAPGSLAWVYAPLVDIKGGSLPVVEPPPKPTPAVSMTIDPTLAAQFIVTTVPTRLATFTPPPPLAIPSFAVVASAQTGAGLPIGLIIVALAALGAFFGIFSLFQGR